jgi:hypothetical protein
MPSQRCDGPPGLQQESSVARKNYSFEKRQRELAKKKKQEEKRLQKAAAKQELTEEHDSEAPAGAIAENSNRPQSE